MAARNRCAAGAHDSQSAMACFASSIRVCHLPGVELKAYQRSIQIKLPVALMLSKSEAR
jgi:hypothetical protein